MITIKAKSSTAVNVGVTYLKPISETHNFKYGIELSTSKLNGYVQVFDRSGCNANWSDAELRIRRPADDLCLTVSMSPGQSITAPLKECSGNPITDYPIKVVRRNHVRSQGDQVHRVVQIENPGVQVLSPGPVRVMNLGVFQFLTRLPANLGKQISPELLAEPVDESELSIARKTVVSHWYRATSLEDGILSYVPWSIQEVKITNRTDKDIELFVEASKDPYTINANSSLSVTHAIRKEAAKTANLFDLSDTTIATHVERLAQIRNDSTDKELTKQIQNVLVELTAIQAARKHIQIQIETKSTIETRLAELIKQEVPPGTLQLLAERLKSLDGEIESMRKSEAKSTVKLASFLFR